MAPYTTMTRKMYPARPKQSTLLTRLVALSTLTFIVIFALFNNIWSNRWSSEQTHDFKKMDDQYRRMLDYAPLIYLDEEETFFPCDMEGFLAHTAPYVNAKPVANDANAALSLNNISRLNVFGDNGRDVFLTSLDDPAKDPQWLHGNPPTSSGLSSARTPIIFLSKRVPVPASDATGRDFEEVIDMMSFYFFNFNAGPRAPGQRPFQYFGNHAGDLEHSVVRFKKDRPVSVYLSRHAAGNLYPYSLIEKDGKRPVLYAGRGTHALYGCAGEHEYTMPDSASTVIKDYTSRGTQWDPALNALLFALISTSDRRPSLILDHVEHTQKDEEINPKTLLALAPSTAPTDWFWFRGKWGDRRYNPEDSRQGTVCGQAVWSDGPTGAASKNVHRIMNCEHERHCTMETERPSVLRLPWGL